MARKSGADGPRSSQLLLRLTASDMDWLDSAAHLHRTTANSYLYDLVRAHIEALKSDPHVMADRRNVDSFHAQDAVTISLRHSRASTMSRKEAVE